MATFLKFFTVLYSFLKTRIFKVTLFSYYMCVCDFDCIQQQNCLFFSSTIKFFNFLIKKFKFSLFIFLIKLFKKYNYLIRLSKFQQQ